MSNAQSGINVVAVSQTLRLLYPFYLVGDIAGLANKLCAPPPTSPNASGENELGISLWEMSRPSAKFLEESLDISKSFLFGKSVLSEEADEWGNLGNGFETYLKLRPKLANSWFGNNVVVVFDADKEKDRLRALSGAQDREEQKMLRSLRVRLEMSSGIEMFISPAGVGLLSICFERVSKSSDEEFSFAEMRELSYRLSHLKYRVPLLRKPHPLIDSDSFHVSRLATEQCQSIPAVDFPLIDRLGKPGGCFTLSELLDYLLEPIQKKHPEGDGFCPIQDQFFVYGIVRFPCSVSLVDPVVRNQMETEVVAFAQVEESHHALSICENRGIPIAVLNECHLVASSVLGACHFVCDQWETVKGLPQKFDAQRVQTCREKYFLAYLIAVIQRLEIIKYRVKSSEIALSKIRIINNRNRKDAGKDVISASMACSRLESDTSILHAKISRFAAVMMVEDVSRREAINCFYRLVQESLRTASNLELLRSALRDLDAVSHAKRESKTLKAILNTHKQAIKTQKLASASQRTLERIQILVFTLSAIQLAGSLGCAFDFSHDFVKKSSALWGVLVGIYCLYLFTELIGGGLKKKATNILTAKQWGIVLLLMMLLWFWWGLENSYISDSKKTEHSTKQEGCGC